MTIKIKAKHVLYAVNGIVWIKYGVITDILRFTRHTVNTVTGAINSVGQGVNDVVDGVGSTVSNLQYNAASVVTISDGDMIKMIFTAIIILFIMFRFGPTVTRLLSGRSESSKSSKSSNRSKSSKSSNRSESSKSSNRSVSSKPSKTDAWKQWYDEYGGNYKTKKDAKKHFDEWYMWEYQTNE